MWMCVMIMTAHMWILRTVLCFSVKREPRCKTCFHFFVRNMRWRTESFVSQILVGPVGFRHV